MNDDWRTLARCELDRVTEWLRDPAQSRLWLCAATIAIGVGAYGATVGMWRAPEMALYVAVKLPAIIFLTILLNGLINGMLAQSLGIGLGFRQTLQAILMSFTIFALIVGSLSPLIFFATLNSDGPTTQGADEAHSRLLVFHTMTIAFAGVTATVRLLGILEAFCGNRRAARATLFAWLAGNLFLGAQVAFLLRPIIGTPTLEVEFLRPDPFEGNFYESLWHAIRNSVNSKR